jgi:hypothetical protein
MRRNLLIPVAFVIGIFAVSCGSGDKHAIAVPKEAAFVFHINAPSLSSKLTWDEIKATNWFKELHSEADDSLARKLMDNPENSGIDTKADLAFFAKRRGQGGYAVFQGSLKNAAAFEAFNKKMDKKLVTGKEGDLNVLRGKEVTVTWNDSRFMYLFDAPFMMTQTRFDGLESSSGPSGKFTSDSLVKFAKELYSLSSDNSLYSDKRFDAMMKEQGDMHLWMNSEQFYSGAMSGALSMLGNLNKLFEGNVSAGTINFENGKISMKSKSYYNKEIGKIYEKYRMKNVDAALLNRIPSQNIVGVFSMNYPPEGLPELLKLVGVDGAVNGFLADFNYSVAEFVKANKGDILLAVTDFDLKKQTMTIPGMEGQPGGSYTTTKPDMQVLFAASINDKPAFEKMVATIKEKVGDNPQLPGLPPISYSLNDNWFAAGTSEAQVNQFLAGGNNNWSAAGKLGGHPMVFYIDLQKVLKPMSDTTQNMSSLMVNESLKMWEDVLFTGGELSDGSFTHSFEVNLVDKSTNSLKQLNLYIDRMAATRHQGAF